MKSRVYCKLIRNSLAVIIIGIIFGYIADYFFIFNENAINWFCSSVAQGFLALLAITAAIGLHNVKNITDNFTRVTDNLARTVTVTNQNANDLKVQRDLHEVINGQDEAGQDFNKGMDDVSNKMIPSLIIIPVLVVLALLVLIFTGSNLKININIEKNLIISHFLSLIFFLSLYSIYEAIKLFSSVFNIRYRSRDN